MLGTTEIVRDEGAASGDLIGCLEDQVHQPRIACEAGIRLYTCRAAIRRADSMTSIFAARVASCPSEAAAAFARRFGPAVIEKAGIVEGFDRRDPYAAALVAPLIADELEKVATAPRSWAHRRYEFAVERSFGI